MVGQSNPLVRRWSLNVIDDEDVDTVGPRLCLRRRIESVDRGGDLVL